MEMSSFVCSVRKWIDSTSLIFSLFLGSLMIMDCANKLSYVLIDQKDNTYVGGPYLLRVQRRYMGEDQVQVIIVKVAVIAAVKFSSLGSLVAKTFYPSCGISEHSLRISRRYK